MRRKIIAGNWKMHKTGPEAQKLAQEILAKSNGIRTTEIVLCPPMVALDPVHQVIKNSELKLGAQTVHWESQGAFTGEISGAMLKQVGCEYVIIGHSERRQYFGETDDYVNRRIGGAIRSRLKPIMCIGETLKQREADQTYPVVEHQVTEGLKNFTETQLVHLVIAYEPIWAIGTGKNATPQQAEEVHLFIRLILTKLFTQEFADAVRIQYGGSVKKENARDLLAQPDIDGALVGGASLEAQSFTDIILAAESVS
jgi:triosephosphate isomerase